MSRVRMLAALVVLGLAVAVTAIVVAVTGHSSKSTFNAGVDVVNIPGSDGAKLNGLVIVPKYQHGTKLPLLVMPASWDENAGQYARIGGDLASHGYVVVAYAQRGFDKSAGLVDFADTPTQQDVSAVITWALSHTPADPAHIGAVGISYGAGMSLLAAERDSRIKAVVALSGWADLGAALDTNNTVDSASLGALLATHVGHLDSQLVNVRDQLLAGNVQPAAQMATAAQRSAITHVAELNAHHTAVMLANAYEDSVLPPNQLIGFFTALTGPKRIQFTNGGHGGPESQGLVLPSGATNSGVWHDVLMWVDHYVRGVDNGVQKQAPVQLRDVVSHELRMFTSWAAVGAQQQYVLRALSPTLDTTLGGLGDGAGLGGDAATGWSSTINAGINTVADAGPTEAGSARYVHPKAALALVRAGNGLVWASEPLASDEAITGIGSVHVTVTPTAASATFFAYLYDVDASSAGTLITFAPYTIPNAKAGTPVSVTVPLRVIGWTVPKGHRIALVIDTVDDRYIASNTGGERLTFSSPADSPSVLALPIAH